MENREEGCIDDIVVQHLSEHHPETEGQSSNQHPSSSINSDNIEIHSSDNDMDLSPREEDTSNVSSSNNKNNNSTTLSQEENINNGSPTTSSTLTSTTTITTTTNTTSTSNTTTTAVDELETVERLEKYSCSEIVFHRQVAARGLLETLHEVRQNHTDLQRVGAVISRFASDSEPSIRAELAEQLPQIACFCLNPCNGVPSSMSNITLPILEQFLADSNSQVRKITQNSLAFMLEQNIVDFHFVEEKISPVLVHLMDITNMDDYRIEAVTTVSKIVRFLGKSITEKVFLQHFSRLCSDVSFHVRRACASNFGEISTVIGRELTESVLLPQFKNLCEDGIWGVRKACADVFVPVSYVCSKQVRQTVLAPLFVSFLCDQSKWVKIAAFQSLGPFISTFADPEKTGLYYTDGGIIVVDDSKDHESNSSGSTDSGCSSDSSNSNEDVMITDACTSSSPSNLPSYAHHSLALNQLNQDINSVCTSSSTPSTRDVNGMLVLNISAPERRAGEVTVGGKRCVTSTTTIITSSSSTGSRSGLPPSESSSYNTFQFWRIPIPDVELDPEITRLSIDSSPFSTTDASSFEEKRREKRTDSMNGAQVEICQDEEQEDAVFTEATEQQKQDNEVTHSDDQVVDEGTVDDAVEDAVEEEEMKQEDKTKTCQVSGEAQMHDGSSLPLDSIGRDVNVTSGHVSQTTTRADLSPEEKLNEFYGITFQRTSEPTGHYFSKPSFLSERSYPMMCMDVRSEEEGVDVNASSVGYQNRLASIKQETIPSDLLEHYLNMTSPVNYETVDHELTHHCAFSFPAVAMTLGRRYWPCLKSTYEALASDVQWKVRWTLASSLHQMALILGPEHTSRDLLPVFLTFMKDLDEVRFGILQNLSSTLRLLNRPEQLAILPRIMEFLKMDNPRNWRFRYTLAEQVMGIAPLYSPTDIKEYLLPIAYALLKDKVSEVRLGAIRLLSTLMRHFFCDTSLPPSASVRQGSLSGEQAASSGNHSTVTSSSSTMMITDQMESVEGSVTSICLKGQTQTTSSDTQSKVSTSSQSNSVVPQTTTTSSRLPLDQVSLELISELTALIQSNKWVFRQSFVFLCEQMIADQSLPVQVFNDHFFACLLSLQNDRVNNVRLALSRCLTRSIHGNVMFHEKQPLVTAVLEHFRNDPDLDVRRFATNLSGDQQMKEQITTEADTTNDAVMTDVSESGDSSTMQSNDIISEDDTKAKKTIDR